MTGRDLISASLRLIGVIAPGESLDAGEATDGLQALNRMIDSWSTESLLVFTKTRDEFPLTPGKQVYTLGAGGDFNVPRPMAIEEAYLRVTTVTPALELPMHVCTKEQWERILVKELTSTYPLYLYAEGTYPLDTLHVYPNPTVANDLVLWSRKPLSDVATLDTVLAFPPGYERALVYNLAFELSSEYGKPAPDQVVMIATEAKATIKRQNSKPRYLRVDPAISARSSFFNWMTGDTE